MKKLELRNVTRTIMLFIFLSKVIGFHGGVQAANLIFSSDFNPNVALSAPKSLNNSSSHPNTWWPIVGKDQVTGFSWPIVLNGRPSHGLQAITQPRLNKGT